mgnify:CR=1 FL=1
MSDLLAPARQLARWSVNHGLPSLALRRAGRRGDLQGQLDTRLAAGDDVDVGKADFGFQFFDRQPNNAPPRVRKRDNPAAIDINRARPAGGQGIGLIRAEVDGADIQKQFRRFQSAVVFTIVVRGGWHRHSLAIKMRPT